MGLLKKITGKKQTVKKPKMTKKAKRRLMLRKMVPKDKPLPKADALTTDKVHDILQSDFVQLFNASKVSSDAYYKILGTVTTDSEFSTLSTYHNVPMAESVLNEVVGFGVITELIRKHPGITDIVFNGRDLWYSTNDGKHRYGDRPDEDDRILTPAYISRLITKFSNNSQNQESVTPTTPIFNGMYGDMRMSVTDTSLTPPGSSDATFAIRVTRVGLPLNTHDFSSFAPFFVYSKLICPIVKGRSSVLISGETGTAKTSLLKLMVKPMQERDRLIMVEDTPETHLDRIYPQKDILNWVTNKESHTTIADLVQTSLRFDPERVFVGEVRDGKSAYQMFQSVKTGHSLMTTLHSKSNAGTPGRFAGMIREVMNIDPNVIIDEFLDYMDVGVHLSAKTIGGHTFRFMDQLVEFVPKSKKHPKGINVLFNQELENRDGVAWRKWRTYPASKKIKDTIKRNYDAEFNVPFTQDGVHVEKVPLNS